MHNGETSTSLQEANRFLLHYMHESELSARNLRECIFIWAIHNNLPTKNIVDLIHSHKKEIDNQPLAPTGENYDEYRTDDVLDLLNEIISCCQELEIPCLCIPKSDEAVYLELEQWEVDRLRKFDTKLQEIIRKKSPIILTN